MKPKKLTRDEIRQMMIDIVVSTICLKMRQVSPPTWAKSGLIFEDETLHKVRRIGIYGLVDADDGMEYGGSVSCPLRHCPMTRDELRDLARRYATDTLNRTLAGELKPRYVSDDAIAAMRKSLDEGVV